MEETAIREKRSSPFLASGVTRRTVLIVAATMVDAEDPAAIAPATLKTSTEKITYTALSESGQVPLSMLWHQNRGRQSRNQAAANKRYLNPCEEKAPVDYFLRAAERGGRRCNYFCSTAMPLGDSTTALWSCCSPPSPSQARTRRMRSILC
jgi:hypothetical protein